jgi:hypothetical protein
VAEAERKTSETKKTEEHVEERKTEEPKREELTPDRFEEVKREAIENRRKLRAAESAHDETRKELEQLRAERESAEEKAVREAVDAARGEERAKWQRRLVEAQVAARAAGKLTDPADAVHLLSVDELLAEEDEDKRERLMDKALDELVEQKPYLALNGTRERESGRLVTQGARSRAPVTGDKTADDWFRSRGRRRR